MGDGERFSHISDYDKIMPREISLLKPLVDTIN